MTPEASLYRVNKHTSSWTLVVASSEEHAKIIARKLPDRALLKRFVAAQKRSEVSPLSQRIGKDVCHGLTQAENTCTKTSPARMSFGTHGLIEKLLSVTKRFVERE